MLVRRTAALAGVWLAGAAAAQDAASSPELDVHGSTLPPPAGAPLASFTPFADPAGSWSVGAVAELADGVLVAQVGDATDDVLGGLFGVDLGGSWQLARRLGLGATLPVWLTSDQASERRGPALGDAWLWAPIGLVLPPEEARGFGLSVVPSLGLPTGNAGRLLGDRGFRPGVRLVPGVGVGPLALAASLGVEAGASATLSTQTVGGPSALFGASATVDVGRVSIAGELRGGLALGTPRTAADTPVEALLSVGGRLGPGWVAVGAGHGLTRGIGSPAFRGLLGGGFAHRVAASSGPDEVAAAPLVLSVAGAEGRPIAGATVTSGERALGVTASDGTLPLVPGRALSRDGVSVAAPGWETGRADVGESGTVKLVLTRSPVAVALRVQDQAGQAVNPTLKVTSLDDPTRPPLTPTGSLVLPVGRWALEVSAPGAGVQRREITVAPGSATPVEVVLLPAGGDGAVDLRVTDPEGGPVAGARVLVDGQPVGVTGAGGDVSLASVAPGKHAVAVRSEAFTERSEDVVVAGEGVTSAPIALERVPGSVRVRVEGPDGAPVDDAVLRFDGPRRLAPTPVGPGGERLQVLGPGEWTLLVTSAQYGFQERVIDVPPDAWQLIDVAVVLRPSEDGAADLLVRVIGPTGEPVDGAEVSLDGQTLGKTSTGGQLRLQRLDAGRRDLSVEAPWHLPAEVGDLDLEAGYQERVVVLDWVEGAVRVTAHTPTGPVADAVVRFTGPEPIPNDALGPSGTGMVELSPGDWTVLVTSSKGFSEASLAIPKGTHHLFDVDALLVPSEEGTASLVVEALDPDGKPVEGAAVALDGEAEGSTTAGGQLSLTRLDPGKRAVTVTAPPLYAPGRAAVTLGSAPAEAPVTLGWAEGTVRVTVTDPQGTPIPDAVIRADGPARVAPTPAGPAGEARLALGAGSWEILVTSPTRGFAEVPVAVAATDRMKAVPVQMVPVAAGRSDLLVRVRDPDGNPVPGAAIEVAGERATTGTGGSALISDLSPGAASIQVTAPGFVAAKLNTSLDEGSEERFALLEWVPRTLDVAVTDPSGAPVDAEIRLVGPEDRPAVHTGADGVEQIALRPGAWQVIAATDTLGPSRADVVIGADGAKVSLKLEPTRVEVTGATVKLKEEVPFDFDRATLRPDSAPILQQVANTLLSRPGLIKVEVQGHTDDRGTVAYNQDLSQARAEAVVKALVDLGVPPEKLVAVGYGTQRPLVANDTDEHRAQNRRVAFEIVEQASP